MFEVSWLIAAWVIGGWPRWFPGSSAPTNGINRLLQDHYVFLKVTRRVKRRRTYSQRNISIGRINSLSFSISRIVSIILVSNQISHRRGYLDNLMSLSRSILIIRSIHRSNVLYFRFQRLKFRFKLLMIWLQTIDIISIRPNSLMIFNYRLLLCLKWDSCEWSWSTMSKWMILF